MIGTACQMIPGRLVKAAEPVEPLYPAARLLKGSLLDLHAELASAGAELQRVQQEAEQARRALEQELAQRRAQAEAEAGEQRAAAYREGSDQGRRDWRVLVDALRSEFEQIQSQWPDAVARLALRCARKVLDIEFKTRPDAVADLVRRVLDAARFCREVTVVLHPQDLEAIDATALQTPPVVAEVLRYRADAAMPRNSVRLETNRGVLDGALETQLARLEAHFLPPCQPVEGPSNDCEKRPFQKLSPTPFRPHRSPHAPREDTASRGA